MRVFFASLKSSAPTLPVRNSASVFSLKKSGPARRNTKATPGLMPFAIKAAAMGVDALAQI